MEKISKLNIHSIIKKSTRVSSHLKHLTGFAPQVRLLRCGPGAAVVAFRLPGAASGVGLVWFPSQWLLVLPAGGYRTCSSCLCESTHPALHPGW